MTTYVRPILPIRCLIPKNTEDIMPQYRTVTIPSRDDHDGFYSMTVTLEWTCPVCGGPRGEPFDTVSYDGSRRLHCDGWRNACGHVDKYADVRKEAADPRLQDGYEPPEPHYDEEPTRTLHGPQ